MALTKSHIYRTLWEGCDQLRGGMDASQYKDYVLTLLFLKYISDKYGHDPHALFLIPPNCHFNDLIQLKGNPEIGERINVITQAIANKNDLQGIVDQADFNDESKLGRGKAKQDRLSNLIGIFEGLDLRVNRADGDDLLGDAYEYLMRNFATQSGRSKGQFYTPAEVSRVMAQIIGIEYSTRADQTLYDPTCGSGSLLIKAAAAAPLSLTIFGQEKDSGTYALARMNMILHGHGTADIRLGDTLVEPQFKDQHGSLRRFDFAVANPPFSDKAWTNGLIPEQDAYGRFADGIPPAKNGDYAFLLHLIASLNSTGKGAIILPHGVLFRGNREAEIRRRLVERGLIKGIIGLPPNLFYGTGIPACIIVIDKTMANVRKSIFMLDASGGYSKDGNKNRLRERDIHQIVDVFNRQLDVPRYARMVPLDEIAANDYNLNLPRYIDSSPPPDQHNLTAHLRGDIPAADVAALAPYWEVFPTLRDSLFVPASRPDAFALRVAPEAVQSTIRTHPEVEAYMAAIHARFAAWCAQQSAVLAAIDDKTIPRILISTLAESLLKTFAELPLLDPYTLYQRLLDYWTATMQDDVYGLVAEGWLKAAQPRPFVSNGNDTAPNVIVGKHKYLAELLPPTLLLNRYFAPAQQQLATLSAATETAKAELDGLIEEYAGEDGLLGEEPTLTNVKRLRRDPTLDASEQAMLDAYLHRHATYTAARAAATAAHTDLMHAVFNRYATLTVAEITELVVQDKWLATLAVSLTQELDRLPQQLAARVRELYQRYARPLPELEQEVAQYQERVAAHLRQMGLRWE